MRFTEPSLSLQRRNESTTPKTTDRSDREQRVEGWPDAASILDSTRRSLRGQRAAQNGQDSAATACGSALGKRSSGDC